MTRKKGKNRLRRILDTFNGLLNDASGDYNAILKALATR